MSEVVKKHAGGRPLSIPTPEKFIELANAFFEKCDADNEPYTITGLALAVGLCGRKELWDYEQKPEFAPAVKNAKSRVENYNERMLQKGQTTGAIFALKNFGWSDRQDVNISGHTTSDVRTLGIVTIDDPAQLSKTCEAMRLWQQKRNQLNEKQADAEVSPSPLEKLRNEQQTQSNSSSEQSITPNPSQSQGREPPTKKQW